MGRCVCLFVCVVILGMKRRTAKDGGKERM